MPPTAEPAPQTAAIAPPPGAEPAVAPDAKVQTASVPSVTSATPVGAFCGPARQPNPRFQPMPPCTAGAAMAIPAASDAGLGFKPSSAPPLDPSVNQFVSAPIVPHYRQTAMLAGDRMAGNAAVPAVPPKGAAADARFGDRQSRLAFQCMPAGLRR